MNELHSHFHDTGWTCCAGKVYPVKCLSIEELWASAPIVDNLYGKPFYETLKSDIAADGLYNPLICVYATHAELIEKKKRHKHAMNELPFDPNNTDLNARQYVIWGGSNRYVVAKDLGYTHVDCTIIPKIDVAHRLQSEMRRPFKERYYSKRPHSNKNKVNFWINNK